ncbi:MAG: hypothetical protein UV64_C0027G0006 [Parcubacteria group bacterium GW2011_GWC1_43_11b]|nr:MAG: hypothetical protein UV50_C0006G0056 [Parcubacteria group bacterium GW2011_GWB1_42_9]KKS88195.1 MAG: hypothetical protein UV64_C0027G0006 [Parcubacteria group bacterium GW2011_GWC1_43_11b]KKT08933.1 MAG: hypothetical protein UV88_C0017G0003 [Parcubacteria group bacterium GW2011_GWA1_43_21]
MVKQNLKSNSGYLLISALVFGSIGILMISALTGWLITNWKAVTQLSDKEKAFQIAEAGIEYYRWHLAHDGQDFQDGTMTTGPYVHDFYDQDGNLLGTYELTITTSTSSSPVVTVLSRGHVASSTVSRAIEVKLSRPSLANYALVVNSNVRFGEGTETFGPIHSNGGIRFDGLAHNIVTSAKEKYDDPDHEGGDEFGVHTHLTTVDPVPPALVPERTDVFEIGRYFPVPAIDFAGFTADMANIKTASQSSGRYFGPSGQSGYNVILKTDRTFDLEKIDSIDSPGGGCQNDLNQEGWGTWSIKKSTLVGNYPIPANGLIFLEDDVWVEGQINNYRVTIVAATFPETALTAKSITVNKNLLYTNYDGRDATALFAQKNINIGENSENVIRLDATLIAKNGRVGRYYYGPSCGTHNRQDITVYGMIATNQRYGFAYVDNLTGELKSGYANRYIIYDGNLLYNPPPYLPLATDNYQVISWRELR